MENRESRDLKSLPLDLLKEKMTELFNGAESRSDLVATFLAILELAKSKKINVIGDGADVDIELLATDIEEMNSEEWE